MDENQDDLKKLISKGIKVANFVQFEADCEELLGIEINSIIEYFSHKYATTKDKFIITFADFIDITQRWAESFLLKEKDQDEEKIEPNHIDQDKADMQSRSKDNLIMKFDIHRDKIKEIFQNYSETVKLKPNDTSSIDVNNKESKEKQKIEDKQDSKLKTKNDFINQEISVHESQGPQVKLKNIGKIFDDIAYLTGISVMSYKEYLNGSNLKKSSSGAVEEVIHHFWKQLHEGELEDLRKTKQKSTIYKPAQQLDDQTLDKAKKPAAAKKGQKTDNVANGDQGVHADSKSITSVQKPSTEHAKLKAKKMKKVKKMVKKQVPKKDGPEGEMETVEVETEVEVTDDEVDKLPIDTQKSIIFEDEKFKQEKGEVTMPYEKFQPFLKDFIDNHQEFVLLDNNGE